jgi:hypothetical protein
LKPKKVFAVEFKSFIEVVLPLTKANKLVDVTFKNDIGVKPKKDLLLNLNHSLKLYYH